MTTPIKDVNLKILSELDDRSLFNFCLANKDINEMCKDDFFWRNRFLNRFGEVAAGYKLENRNWRNHYLKVASDLSKYSEDPWRFFENITWNLRDDNFEEIGEDSGFLEPELYHNNFWMLNLGKDIIISFPIDPLDDLDFIERKYISDTYFTPAKVLKLIYNFYQEPISQEELEQQQNVGNIFAEDYDITDLGKILRIDLIGNHVYLASEWQSFIQIGENTYKLNIFIND